MAIDKIVAEYRLELDGLRKDFDAVKGQLKSLDEKISKSADTGSKKFDEMGNKVSGRLSSAFTKLGGVIAAAFAIDKIGDFISSSIELAARADGIRTAFNRLNDPSLLSRLREATKGTVSDLQLMQTAVKAANFKLPLDQLAKYLKFAQQRAIETGESIDNLVESIVLGISRKSIPIIDNLGISAQQVQEEFQKTGDFAKAVGNIIDESMGQAGETILTTAERQAQLRAEIENTKVEIGEKLLPVVDTLLSGLLNVADAFDRAFESRDEKMQAIMDNIGKSGMSVEELTTQYERNKAELDDILKRYPNLLNINRQLLALTSEGAVKERDRADSLIRQNEAIEVYINAQKNSNTQTQAQIGLLGQLQQEIENLTELQNKSNDPAEIKRYTVEIDKLQKRIKYLTTIKEAATTATTKQKEAVWGLGFALSQLAKQFNTLSSERAIETFGIDVDKTADAIMNAHSELDKLIKLTPLTVPAVEGSAEDSAKDWYDDWAYYGNELTRLWDGISVFFKSQEEGKLALLQSRLDDGLISEKQYNAEVKKIQKEQAKRDKLLAVFNVLADTPAAIVQGLSQGGPAGAVLAAGIAAVQLATALALDIPQFKKGVIDFQGKGTETSDSNLVMISKGESVMTAKETRRFKPVLEAIRKDKFDEYVMNVYTKQIRERQKDTAITWDDYRLMLELAKNTNQSKENTKVIVNAIEKRPHRF